MIRTRDSVLTYSALQGKFNAHRYMHSAGISKRLVEFRSIYELSLLVATSFYTYLLCTCTVQTLIHTKEKETPLLTWAADLHVQPAK